MASTESKAAIVVVVVILILLGGLFVLGGGSPGRGIQVIERTIFQTVAPDDTSSGFNVTWELQAQILASWSCVTPSMEVNVTWGGDEAGSITTTKPDWFGLGSSRVLTDSRLFGDVGAVIWVQMTIDDLGIDSIDGFLIRNGVTQQFDLETVHTC